MVMYVPAGLLFTENTHVARALVVPEWLHKEMFARTACTRYLPYMFANSENPVILGSLAFDVT